MPWQLAQARTPLVAWCRLYATANPWLARCVSVAESFDARPRSSVHAEERVHQRDERKSAPLCEGGIPCFRYKHGEVWASCRVGGCAERHLNERRVVPAILRGERRTHADGVVEVSGRRRLIRGEVHDLQPLEQVRLGRRAQLRQPNNEYCDQQRYLQEPPHRLTIKSRHRSDCRL